MSSNMTDVMTEGMPPRDKSCQILNPSSLKDYIVSADFSSESHQSLKKSFTNPWEIYNICKEADSDPDFISGNNPDILWQKNVLNMACHLDSGKPLHRVIFWGGADRSSNIESNLASTTKVEITGHNIILDIEGIKIAPTNMYDRETPIICVKFAMTDGSGGPLSDNVTRSLNDLPGKGLEGVLTLYCSQDEINSGLLMLEKNSLFIHEGYLKKWSKNKVNKSGFFKPSFLRPALKPAFPHEEMRFLIQEEKMQRKNERATVRDEKLRVVAVIKAEKKAATYSRRMERQKRNEAEEKAKKKIGTTLGAKVCAVFECECEGSFQCTTCKSVCYCGVAHQRSHWPTHREMCLDLAATYALDLTIAMELEAANKLAAQESKVAAEKAASISAAKAKLTKETAAKAAKAAKVVTPVVKVATPVPSPVVPVPVAATIAVPTAAIRVCRSERTIMGPATGPTLPDNITKDLPITSFSPSPYAPGPINYHTYHYPSSSGPNSVCPKDIWDDRYPFSLVLDLKVLMDEVPTVFYTPEHSLFWIRILLPFLRKGTEQVVDKTGNLKFNIKDKHDGYDVIGSVIRESGWKDLKGFFPTRRHGDFLRVYIEDVDASQTW